MARSSLGGIFVTFGLLAATASTWAHSFGTPATTLPVVVRNFGRVPSLTIDEAQSIVGGLFRGIGVQVSWVTPEDLRRTLPAAPESPCDFASLVRLNLISPDAEDELAQDVLGTAVPAAGFVRIAPRRIEARAAKAGVAAGLVLAEVMAHEIGHVLMPHSPHRLAGVMTERLDVKDMRSSRVMFCPREATDIRAAIAERQTGCRR